MHDHVQAARIRPQPAMQGVPLDRTTGDGGGRRLG